MKSLLYNEYIINQNKNTHNKKRKEVENSRGSTWEINPTILSVFLGFAYRDI